uniref:Uncharacterized protein n=1 Tax=Panagrolaimus sp. JU765 TaxID=591449 RepID=A0AC34R8H4_9BILA
MDFDLHSLDGDLLDDLKQLDSTTELYPEDLRDVNSNIPAAKPTNSPVFARISQSSLPLSQTASDEAVKLPKFHRKVGKTYPEPVRHHLMKQFETIHKFFLFLNAKGDDWWRSQKDMLIDHCDTHTYITTELFAVSDHYIDNCRKLKLEVLNEKKHCEKLISKLSDLTVRYDSLNMKLDDKDAEIQRLRSKVKTLENDKKMIVPPNKSLEDKIKTLERELIISRSENMKSQHFQKQKDFLDSRINELTNDLLKKNAENDKLKDDLIAALKGSLKESMTPKVKEVEVLENDEESIVKKKAGTKRGKKSKTDSQQQSVNQELDESSVVDSIVKNKRSKSGKKRKIDSQQSESSIIEVNPVSQSSEANVKESNQSADQVPIESNIDEVVPKKKPGRKRKVDLQHVESSLSQELNESKSQELSQSVSQELNESNNDESIAKKKETKLGRKRRSDSKLSNSLSSTSIIMTRRQKRQQELDAEAASQELDEPTDKGSDESSDIELKKKPRKRRIVSISSVSGDNIESNEGEKEKIDDEEPTTKKSKENDSQSTEESAGEIVHQIGWTEVKEVEVIENDEELTVKKKTGTKRGKKSKTDSQQQAVSQELEESSVVDSTAKNKRSKSGKKRKIDSQQSESSIVEVNSVSQSSEANVKESNQSVDQVPHESNVDEVVPKKKPGRKRKVDLQHVESSCPSKNSFVPWLKTQQKSKKLNLSSNQELNQSSNQELNQSKSQELNQSKSQELNESNNEESVAKKKEPKLGRKRRSDSKLSNSLSSTSIIMTRRQKRQQELDAEAASQELDEPTDKGSDESSDIELKKKPRKRRIVSISSVSGDNIESNEGEKEKIVDEEPTTKKSKEDGSQSTEESDGQIVHQIGWTEVDENNLEFVDISVDISFVDDDNIE